MLTSIKTKVQRFRKLYVKDTNWRKIELRLNILQIKIYVAKQYNNKGALLKRQNYKFLACGSIFLPTEIIATDHIKPIARGGSHKITSLQPLHVVCHDKKR